MEENNPQLSRDRIDELKYKNPNSLWKLTYLLTGFALIVSIRYLIEY